MRGYKHTLSRVSAGSANSAAHAVVYTTFNSKIDNAKQQQYESPVKGLMMDSDSSLLGDDNDESSGISQSQSKMMPFSNDSEH